MRQDKRTLLLEKYTSTMPAPPARNFFQERVRTWEMMGNDALGNCTCAAAGHMIEQWTAYASTEIHPTDAQIIKAYEDVGGYVPGRPETDQGAVMLDVLNYWRQTGIAGHQIVAYVRVRIASPFQMMAAASLFGNVYLGLQLPLSAKDQFAKGQEWEVAGVPDFDRNQPGSWGGHCVPIVGYDPKRLLCVTWGATKFMSWDFLRAYADEAYAVLTLDWIRKDNVSPSGFNINSLIANMKTVTQHA